ncbi:DMT family transporter [Tropicimonas sp. IMCC34043]|uniref:DMT family transporter n=1 Tax=Tropicimonas sp. IMCC34043 TaxID=2248760 RepID=UPI00130027BD|nr:DMT family transporter [Tropicimonas sp. IMCC34043]
MSLPLIFLAMAMGAMMSVYLPMISRSAQILGSGPLANVVFYAVGLLTSVALALATGSRAPDFAKIPGLSPWLLTSGAMSAVMILGSAFLVPRIGIGGFFVLMVAGQILAAMVFSQLGLFGAPAMELTAAKLLGAAMVVGGVWLVTFR